MRAKQPPDGLFRDCTRAVDEHAIRALEAQGMTRSDAQGVREADKIKARLSAAPCGYCGGPGAAGAAGLCLACHALADEAGE